MYLYKLPEANQYLFIKEKSVYRYYKPKDLHDLLLVTEKTYSKYSMHFGLVAPSLFRLSAVELVKQQFLKAFNANQLGMVQRGILSFFIHHFKISKEQYSEALQKILAEDHSFDLQLQLARYETIKNQYPGSFFEKFLIKLRS